MIIRIEYLKLKQAPDQGYKPMIGSSFCQDWSKTSRTPEIIFPDIHRLIFAKNSGFSDDALCHVIFIRKVEHDVLHRILHDRPQSARARVPAHSDPGDLPEGFGLKYEVDSVGLHELLILLDQRIPGLSQDPYQCFFVQLVEDNEDGKPANEFRGQAELDQILRNELSKLFRKGLFLYGIECRAKTQSIPATLLGNEFLDSGKSTTADEQNVARIDLDERLVWVLAAALRRHRCHSALEDLQERLLHALA
jgi:hypothetical protein